MTRTRVINRANHRNPILSVITSNQASECTKYHCLFGYYFLYLSVSELKEIYHKSSRTIYYWISRWEDYQSVSRLHLGINARKYDEEKRSYILQLFESYPCYFLDEVQSKFIKKFKMNISISTIWRIMHDGGLTRQVMERRAIQISVNDIVRFSSELLQLPHGWSYQSLIFLDEVGFDNRDMLRKRGYGIKGKRIVFRGEFTRKPRCSLLCYLGINGIIEVFCTEGTFDRFKFINYCRNFALSGQVEKYPGKNSVWILDGASIHCDPFITHYLRSLGILTIYLPAYCPFFNPIEIVFGNIKSTLRRYYVENRSMSDMKIFLATVLSTFKNKCARKIFKKCGYIGSGIFNPGVGFGQEIKSFGFGDTND
jgi:transposase